MYGGNSASWRRSALSECFSSLKYVKIGVCEFEIKVKNNFLFLKHLIQMALSPPKVLALQQCFLTPPVEADLPERLQYSQQNCMQ